jgi:hypothetical protein
MAGQNGDSPVFFPGDSPVANPERRDSNTEKPFRNQRGFPAGTERDEDTSFKYRDPPHLPVISQIWTKFLPHLGSMLPIHTGRERRDRRAAARFVMTCGREAPIRESGAGVLRMDSL